MAQREGLAQLNVRIPEELSLQVNALAASYEGGKNELVLYALKSLIEGTFLHTATDALHQRVASNHSDILTALEVVSQHMAMLQEQYNRLENRIRAVEDEYEKRYTSLLQAFDRLKTLPSEKTGILQRLQRTS